MSTAVSVSPLLAIHVRELNISQQRNELIVR